MLKSQKGIAVLLIVIVITSIALSMSLGAFFLGIGRIELGYTSRRSGELLNVARGCIEETLLQIKSNLNYGLDSGDISLNIGNSSCIINVSGTSSNRIIIASSTVSNFYKKIQVDLTLSENTITDTSWEEQTD